MPDLPSRTRTAPAAGTWGPAVLSLLLGSAFTFALFLGMAHFGNLAPAVAPPDFADLRAVTIPFEPPPPPRAEPAPTAAEPTVSTVTGLDLAPSDSPVKIAVSPPNLDALTAGIQAAPPALIQIGQLVGSFKPQMDSAESAQHVYQRSEVDRVPTVLYRNPPDIPMRLIHTGETLRVTLLLIIDTEGAVTNVRVAKSSGSPEVDAIAAENIQTWGFSPAIKKGRKVRCLIQQLYILTRATGSHFEA